MSICSQLTPQGRLYVFCGRFNHQRRWNTSTKASFYDIAVVGDGPLGSAFLAALHQSPLSRDLRLLLLRTDTGLKKDAPSLLSPRSVRFLKVINAWDRIPEPYPISRISIVGLDASGPAGRIEFDLGLRGPGVTSLGHAMNGSDLASALEAALPPSVHRVAAATVSSTRAVGNGVELTYTGADSGSEQTPSVATASLVVRTHPEGNGNALSVTMASRAALRVFVRGPPAGEPAAAHYRYNSDGTLFHYLPLSSSSAMIVYFTDNQKCDALWQESDASPDLFLERLRADVLLAGDPNISAPEGITTVRRENGAGYMMLRPAEGRQAVLQHAACSPGLPGSDPYALGFYSAIAFANVVHDACEVGQDLGSALVLDRYACRAREYAVQLMAVPHGADLAYGAGNGASSVFGGAINALRPAKEAIAVVLSGDYVESLRAAVTIH